MQQLNSVQQIESNQEPLRIEDPKMGDYLSKATLN